MSLFCFSLAGARMAFAGAIKRSTESMILLQGGIAFLLDAPDAHLSVRMSRVQAACSPYCEDPRKLGSRCDRNCFTGHLRQIRMNRDFPLPPIRSTHGQFGSGLATGYGAATMRSEERRVGKEC